MLYALPVCFVLGLLCSQGSRAGRLALTAIFFSLIISVSAVLDTYLELLGTLGPLNQLLLAISILADHEQLERSAQLACLREAYYQSLRSQQTRLRRLRHDLRSHLAVLGGLMEGERWEAARAYLKELGESPALAGSQRLCENETVNAVLSAKTEEMEREGTRPAMAWACPACGRSRSGTGAPWKPGPGQESLS